jgi:hypothetical protein
MTRTIRPAQEEADVSEQRICHGLRKSVAYRAFNLNVWQPSKQLHMHASSIAQNLNQLLQVPCDARSNGDPFSVGECCLSTQTVLCLLFGRNNRQHTRIFLSNTSEKPTSEREACAGYLKDRMGAALYRSHIYPLDERWEEYQHFLQTSFFPRLLVMIERIAVTKEGAVPVLDLFRFGFLQSVDPYRPLERLDDVQEISNIYGDRPDMKRRCARSFLMFEVRKMGHVSLTCHEDRRCNIDYNVLEADTIEQENVCINWKVLI